MDIVDKYLGEAKGGKGTPFSGLSDKPITKKVKGKTHYFISMENITSGEIVDGYILSSNISAIHKAVGKKGWIINKFYEK